MMMSTKEAFESASRRLRTARRIFFMPIAERNRLFTQEVAMKGLQLGRIVWFTPHDRPHMTNPAMVCFVKNKELGTVNLHIFPNGSSYVVSDVNYSETPMPNTWRWPAKDEAAPVAPASAK